MADRQEQEGLMPSLLDRLIDPEAESTRGQRGYTVAQMVVAVRRDLEELLNTRQSHTGLPEQFTHLHRSVYAYGLPDLTSLNGTTPAQREEIGGALREVITRFEPRLAEINAEVLEKETDKDRTLRIRIKALLKVDPAPPVAFNTILELTTGHYSVEASEV